MPPTIRIADSPRTTLPSLASGYGRLKYITFQVSARESYFSMLFRI